VPALAVDARGFRIGYGRGFYDRLLPTLPNALTVAIVYDFQLVAEVPEEPFDVPVHVVATDARVLRVR
jgi:5-formyltetrahydrofolate cyclo-ligase